MKFQWLAVQSEQFLQATLDALSAHITVLDNTGRIVTVNKAWRDFAWANELGLPEAGLGANYLDICASAAKKGVEEATLVGQGIQAVLSKSQELFYLEYPCHSPAEQCWFALRITGFEYQMQTWAVVAHENITGRIKAEAALRRSEARYRAIVENQTELICRLSPDGTFNFVNEAYCYYYGKQPEELLGASLDPPPILAEDRQMLVAYYASLTSENPVGKIEHRVVLPNGEIRWQQWTDRAIFDEQGYLVEYQSVGRDITERKQMEAQLRQAETKYRTLVEQLPAITYIEDATTEPGRALYISPQIESLLGIRPVEWLNSDINLWLDHIHPADRERTQAEFLRFFSGGEPFTCEYRILTSQGRVEWVHDTAIILRDQDGRPQVIQGVIFNVTERKQAEQALRESEERFRTLVESSIQGILVHYNAKPLFANQAYARILGYESSGEILAMDSVLSLIAPYEQERLLGYHATRVKGEPAPSQYEYDAVRKDGSIITLQHIITTITWDGAPAMLSTIVDMTESKQAEAALQESERYYRMLTESLTDYVVHLDHEGHIRYINRLAEGYTMEMVRGRHVLDFIAPESHPATIQALRTVLETGQPVTFENFGQQTPTTQSWYFTRLIPISDGSGLTTVLLIATDITERKQAEQALRRSEGRLRLAQRLAGLGIWEWEIASDNVTWSEEMFPIYGISPAEFTGKGKDYLSFTHPDDRQEQRERIQKVLERARKFQVETGQTSYIAPDPNEFRIVRADGAISYVRADRTAIMDDNGQPLRMLGVMLDISSEKEREETLRFQKTLLECQSEASPDGILVVSNDGKWLSFNRRFIEMWGYPNHIIESRSSKMAIQSMLPQLANPEQFLARIEYLYEHMDEQGHDEIMFKDGRVFERHSTSIRDPEGIYYGRVWYFRDITERKRAEEALRRQEAEIRRRNRELSLLNQVIAASAAGLESEAILETACRELALVFDLPQATAALLNQEKTALTIVAEYRTEDRPSALNQIMPVEGYPAAQYLLDYKVPLIVDNAQSDSRLAPIHDMMHQRGTISLLILPLIVEGEVIGSLGLDTLEPRSFSPEEVNLAWSVADQVAGALARSRLVQESRLLSAVVEQSAESIIITNTEGSIIYVNPTFEQISGYTQAEALSQTPRLLKSGRQESVFYRELWTAITAGQVWHGRLMNKKKDGALYTIDATIAPVRNERGHIVNYVALQRDITREMQLEEQLRQAQKMEAIGRLAGGVAHDFNNLLTVIIGHTELLLSSYDNVDDPRQDDVKQIRKAGERAALLTRQLLAFSRQQPLQPQYLSLSQVVINIKEMLRRLIGEHIALITNLTPEPGYVRVDPGQIEQVIMNLAVNARDAMPRGGRLTIETANIELDKTEAEIYGVTPGLYIMLAVSDTGVGMDAETRSRIFEPFFTTKEVGKGTGLGLAMVYGIVEQSGGHVRVESAPERGTTFKIYLPQASPSIPPARGDQGGSASSAEGNETILLVEDEAGVRLVTCKFLQGRGYRVLETGQAEEALHLCRQHAGRIDLLITDVVMPTMSGPELAGQLAQFYPDLKVLYISGYAGQILNIHQIQNAAAILLEKPFSADTLARRVREVLDAPNSRPGRENIVPLRKGQDAL